MGTDEDDPLLPTLRRLEDRAGLFPSDGDFQKPGIGSSAVGP